MVDRHPIRFYPGYYANGNPFIPGSVSPGSTTVASYGGFSITLARPLDLVSGFPDVAYSLRQLTSNYNGPLITVRRGSVASLYDIGFDIAGNLNVNSLLAFANGDDVYISQLWNQGSLGAAGNLIQSSVGFMMQIVSSGSLIRRGANSLGFWCSSAGGRWAATSQGIGIRPHHVNIVALAVQQNGDWRTHFRQNASGGGEWAARIYAFDGRELFYGGGISMQAPSWLGAGSGIILDFNNTSEMWQNGTLVATTSPFSHATNNNVLFHGVNPAGNTEYWVGHHAEMMIFSTKLNSADRFAMYTNQKSYYQHI